MIKILTPKEKNDQVLEAIDRLNKGEIVEVIDASYSGYTLAIGDFRDFGMSEKNVWRTGMNWIWHGPGTISIYGKTYEPGSQTEDVDMDWA